MSTYLQLKPFNARFSQRSNGRDLFALPGSQFGGNAPVHAHGEVDLRVELDELFFGFSSGIRHGYNILIRSTRRDADGNKIPCTCKSELTNEPDFDCSYCFGEGFLSNENWVWTYSTYVGSDGGLTNRIKFMPPGSLSVEFKIFFFRYDTDIKRGDKIVEVKLDEEGSLVLPLVRETIYKPETVNKLRSDNSRIEYIAVYCKEEDAIRLEV